MLIARMLLVSLLSILINRFSSIKIGPKMQFVLMIGALRGGISYALAMNYNDSREQRAILTATLVSILFPIFMCGLPLPFILNKLGLVSESKPAKENVIFLYNNGFMVPNCFLKVNQTDHSIGFMSNVSTDPEPIIYGEFYK